MIVRKGKRPASAGWRRALRNATGVVALAGGLLGSCSVISSPRYPVGPAKPIRARLHRAKTRLATASWYGPGFNGKRTASGEIFDQDRLTAASRTLPLGSRVRVVDLRTGRSVTVRINDRGPYVRGRAIDLSRAAAERIGLKRVGVERVEVAPLATLNDPAAEGDYP